MVILRNRVTAARSGGPRRFSELRDKLVISATGREQADNIISDLDRIDLEVRGLDNAPIIVAEPRTTPRRIR